MRMLGSKASIQVFRWDLIYLTAQLTADKRPGVAELAPKAQTLLTQVQTERDAMEQAEDSIVLSNAVLSKSDRWRDEVLVKLGGVARAMYKDIYSVLFPNQSPSDVARLGVDAESRELSRIQGELAQLPSEHPLRTAHEAELTASEASVKAAVEQQDAAQTAAALARSHLVRFKASVDKARLEIHAQLVLLLKDKAEADQFFRPTVKAPAINVEPEPVAEAKPVAEPVAVPA